jgi:hypothetical protein
MSAETFQARYCERRGVNAAGFRDDLLARTLYPHARPLAPLLSLLDAQYFQADREFIADVAELGSIDGFADALDCYVQHFSNRGFLRHQLRLRISARRMWRIVRETFPEGRSAELERKIVGRGSGNPFDGDPRQSER